MSTQRERSKQASITKQLEGNGVFSVRTTKNREDYYKHPQRHKTTLQTCAKKEPSENNSEFLGMKNNDGIIKGQKEKKEEVEEISQQSKTLKIFEK